MIDDTDPIEELHDIREKMYKEAGGTPEAFVQYLRLLEKKRMKKTATPAKKATNRKPKNRSKTVAN